MGSFRGGVAAARSPAMSVMKCEGFGDGEGEDGVEKSRWPDLFTAQAGDEKWRARRYTAEPDSASKKSPCQLLTL